MELVSLNRGRPQVLVKQGRQYSTSINRRPTPDPVMLTAEGLDGDRVSDDTVHGGRDKAVCVFPIEHYDYFAQRLNRALEAPAFGENFTTRGLLETEVCIGDVFRVGEATVWVTQPRQPCAKLALKHASIELIRWINESAHSGFYFGVLTPGIVRSADRLERVSHPYPQFSIASLTHARSGPRRDAAWLRDLLNVPELGHGYRKQAEKWLNPDLELPDE